MPKERENYEVIPQNGKLIYKKSGELIDTTEGCQESGWIFVMSISKELYVGKVFNIEWINQQFCNGILTSNIRSSLYFINGIYDCSLCF